MARPCPHPGCPELKPCPRHPDRGSRGGSTRAWRTTRAEVLERDDHTCVHCGRPATHVDHLIARRDGGPDTHDNLVAACADCNLGERRRTGGGTPLTNMPKRTPRAFARGAYGFPTSRRDASRSSPQPEPPAA